MDTPNPPSFHAPGQARTDHPRAMTSEPLYEISVENARVLDRVAVDRYGIPSIVLMENAAVALCEHALAMLDDARERSIVIFAGPGNNGGDGFALARHLANHALAPTIVTTHNQDHSTGDARINLNIITQMNLHIIDAPSSLKSSASTPGLVVDALLGTGLTRPITGIAGELVRHINRCKEAGALVLAVDVPSGLNAQTGEPMGDAVVHADRTVTFAALKEGMSAIAAQPLLGELVVAPIGIPTALLDELGTQIHRPHDRP